MVGAGYVGLVSGVCFSDVGNTVYCVDKDQKKIDLLNKGKVPIFEPGLEEILKRNFTPRQTYYFILLLKKYCQKKLNEEPNIIIDTIHSVKGGEANHVLIYSKTNWPASFSHKTKEEKSDEKRVYYTGVTRAKNTLHILSTDYKYNYPIGMDYLMYLKESA